MTILYFDSILILVLVVDIKKVINTVVFYVVSYVYESDIFSFFYNC